VISGLFACKNNEVIALGIGHPVLRRAEPERQFGAEDGDEVVALGGFGHTHDAVEAVVIGECQPRQPETLCLFDQLLR
jgi:hypothetical protein